MLIRVYIFVYRFIVRCQCIVHCSYVSKALASLPFIKRMTNAYFHVLHQSLTRHMLQPSMMCLLINERLLHFATRIVLDSVVLFLLRYQLSSSSASSYSYHIDNAPVMREPCDLEKMALRLRHHKLRLRLPESPSAVLSDHRSSLKRDIIVDQLIADKTSPCWYPFVINMSDDVLWNVVIGDRLQLTVDELRIQRTSDLAMLERWLDENIYVYPIDFKKLRFELGADDADSFDSRPVEIIHPDVVSYMFTIII